MQNWDDLRFFLAIARQGSLAGAARLLRVNHSTVFRRLNALEAAAGVRLFERLSAGYVLTEAGEDLQQRASAVGEIMDELDRSLMGRDYRLQGTVRVTTTDTLAVSILPGHLRRFRDRYPDVVVEVVTDNTFFDLSRREADVALRPADDPPQHLVGRNLATVAWGVYGSRAYVRAHGQPDSAADLAAHALITGSDSLADVPAVRWLRAQASDAAPVYRASSFVAQLAAASCGSGLAVLPCVLADSDKKLVRVLGPIGELESGLWLLNHPDLRDTVRIRALTRFLSDAIQGDREKLGGIATG